MWSIYTAFTMGIVSMQAWECSPTFWSQLRHLSMIDLVEAELSCYPHYAFISNLSLATGRSAVTDEPQRTVAKTSQSSTRR